jgi:hypothetical protein
VVARGVVGFLYQLAVLAVSVAFLAVAIWVVAEGPTAPQVLFSLLLLGAGTTCTALMGDFVRTSPTPPVTRLLRQTGLVALVVGTAAAVTFQLTDNQPAIDQTGYTAAVVLIGYGFGLVAILYGFARESERSTRRLAQQLGVLAGSVPSVAGLAYVLVHTSMTLFLTAGPVYGVTYALIIRDFVRRPPTREEILAVLARVARPWPG